MAKKTVASMQSSTKKTVKIIRAVKTKSDSYTFKEEFVPTDKVDEYLDELNQKK